MNKTIEQLFEERFYYFIENKILTNQDINICLPDKEYYFCLPCISKIHIIEEYFIPFRTTYLINCLDREKHLFRLMIYFRGTLYSGNLLSE
jgi:hypothetical protein